MELFLKICLIGDPAVGKTSLIRRYVYNEFSDDYISTIGTKVSKKVVNIGGDTITLMIWDILGQKQHNISDIYYRGSSGAIFVADLTAKETMDSFPEWYNGFKNIAGDVPVVIALNKNDLDAEYDEEYAIKISSRIGNFPVVRTSAKTGENVERIFEIITRDILKRR